VTGGQSGSWRCGNGGDLVLEDKQQKIMVVPSPPWMVSAYTIEREGFFRFETNESGFSVDDDAVAT